VDVIFQPHICFKNLKKMGLLSGLKSSLFGPAINFHEKIEAGAIVIDVRTPTEFKGGHFAKSKNIPLSDIASKCKKLKGKEVILVCRSGARSGQAKSILTNAGITAYNAGAWQKLNQR